MRYEKLPIVFVSDGAIREAIPDEAWNEILAMMGVMTDDAV